jgi:hypothetical protein
MACPKLNLGPLPLFLRDPPSTACHQYTNTFHAKGVAMSRGRPRDEVAGPATGPVSPFPLRLNGKVIQGFGRGSSEVCCRLVICFVRCSLG